MLFRSGLGIVLAFVGTKLLLHGQVKVPSMVSLLVILSVLGGAIGLSLYKSRRSGNPGSALSRERTAADAG